MVPPFHVGAALTNFRAAATGRLMLRVNDDMLRDNSRPVQRNGNGNETIGELGYLLFSYSAIWTECTKPLSSRVLKYVCPMLAKDCQTFVCSPGDSPIPNSEFI